MINLRVASFGNREDKKVVQAFDDGLNSYSTE